MRVVVLGGGAAGMTAAWELALGGAQVTVLERESGRAGCARRTSATAGASTSAGTASSRARASWWRACAPRRAAPFRAAAQLRAPLSLPAPRIGRIFERMGEELTRLGAEVRLGAQALALEHDGFRTDRQLVEA
jgi:glycine/D-amino acid oxidase-like deaminating enzyme